MVVRLEDHGYVPRSGICAELAQSRGDPGLRIFAGRRTLVGLRLAAKDPHVRSFERSARSMKRRASANCFARLAGSST